MKNKKAQLGKIITSLPVMILIIVIIGIFIFLSAAASLFNSDTFDAAASINPEGSFLAKTVQIKLNDGETKNMLVLDAYLEYDNNNIERDVFEEQLNKMLTPESPCLALAIGEGPNPAGKYGGAEYNDFMLILENNDIHEVPIGAKPSYFSRYRSELKSLEVMQKEKKAYIEYYLGECKNE